MYNQETDTRTLQRPHRSEVRHGVRRGSQEWLAPADSRDNRGNSMTRVVSPNPAKRQLQCHSGVRRQFQWPAHDQGVISTWPRSGQETIPMADSISEDTPLGHICPRAHDVLTVNPRPAGVWLVTRPAGGGGPKGPPPLRSPKLLNRFPNFKRHSIALYVNYPYKAKNLTRRSLMTSQVR